MVRFQTTVLMRRSECFATEERRRCGVSIVELLVVLAVLGLLAALILPAVQSSREGARRMRCLSNLHQIGLAVTSYAEVYSTLPSDGGSARQSFHVRLLPFTENDQLYSEIDFSVAIDSQAAIATRRPEFLNCPSDPVADGTRAFNSYSGNAGWLAKGTSSPDIAPGSETIATGVIVPLAWGVVRPGDISDGMSTTALVCETLPANGQSLRRVVWQEAPSSLPTYHRPPDVIANDCFSATSWGHMARGAVWCRSGYGVTLYEHSLPPNSRNCVWAYPAMSEHSADGVNLAYCDGSVKFVSSSISSTLWAGMGTRNGSEHISRE